MCKNIALLCFCTPVSSTLALMNSTLTPLMHNEEPKPKAGTPGLAPEVKKRLSATLSKIVPEWLAEAVKKPQIINYKLINVIKNNDL